MGKSFIAALLVELAAAFLGVLIAAGAPISTELAAAILVLVGVLGAIATLVLWAVSVPRKQVLELLVGDSVVAGPANDVVPVGAEVRQIEPRRAAE